MKKPAAISIAVSICATVFGIGQLASADPTAWKLVGRNARDNTPYLYDENSVRHPNKDVFVMHVSAGGKVVALGLSCSRETYTTSISADSRDFRSPIPIRPDSFPAKLHQRFCPTRTQTIRPIMNERNLQQQAQLDNINLLMRSAASSWQR